MKTLVVAAGQARGLIEEALQRRGHDAVVVSGIESALERQREENPALIVIAAASCAMDGLSGCAALRENATRSDTTILYVGDGALEALAALDAGADDHLSLDADGLDLRIAVAERTIGERGDHLRHEARFDELTGLLNRRYFLERLSISQGAARRHTLPLCVCLCDVDEFKRVNDNHGHAAGDSVLRRLGELIRDSLRAEDLAGRLGGDEFCLALPYTQAREARVAIERLRCQVAATNFRSPAGERLRVTISFGLADTTSRSCTIESLLEQADRALDRAKEEGRNRVLVAS